MSKCICGVCGKNYDDSERHFHFPDFALLVNDCKWYLARYTTNGKGEVKTEVLNYNIPEEWAYFIVETCGGSISTSGIYRLPGMIWEWVVAKCREDKRAVIFLEKKINKFIKEHKF